MHWNICNYGDNNVTRSKRKERIKSNSHRRPLYFVLIYYRHMVHVRTYKLKMYANNLIDSILLKWRGAWMGQNHRTCETRETSTHTEYCPWYFRLFIYLFLSVDLFHSTSVLWQYIFFALCYPQFNSNFWCCDECSFCLLWCQ